MKRLCILSAILLLVGSAFAQPWTTGFGKKVTVTTTPQQISGFTAGSVSVYNASGADVFATVNTDTNSLGAASVTNAVVVPSGMSYTFDTIGQTSIDRVNLATTNSTATVYVGSF